MVKKCYHGKEISEWGISNGRVDYACLAECFNHVSAGDFIPSRMGEWELVNGSLYYDDDERKPKCICQYFIVDSRALDCLKEANEIVFYDEELDLYIWAVTHCGMSWEGALTSIKITW